MTTYSMTPINNGTRLRENHSTVNTPTIQFFNANELLEGDELWVAPADGVEVKKGDKWLRVTKRNGTALPQAGWTAYIHKGVPYCDNFKEVSAPPAPTDPVFPEWFTLTDPNGVKARYDFVRIVE